MCIINYLNPDAPLTPQIWGEPDSEPPNLGKPIIGSRDKSYIFKGALRVS